MADEAFAKSCTLHGPSPCGIDLQRKKTCLREEREHVARVVHVITPIISN